MLLVLHSQRCDTIAPSLFVSHSFRATLLWQLAVVQPQVLLAQRRCTQAQSTQDDTDDDADADNVVARAVVGCGVGRAVVVGLSAGQLLRQEVPMPEKKPC